eukprot:2184438-Pleurochrysis_carterae.AAC.2
MLKDHALDPCSCPTCPTAHMPRRCVVAESERVADSVDEGSIPPAVRPQTLVKRRYIEQRTMLALQVRTHDAKRARHHRVYVRLEFCHARITSTSLRVHDLGVVARA